MKIVVFGGTGLIGSRLVRNLRQRGHEAIAASPRTGIDALSGQGVAQALAGAAVVADVMNAPSWEDAAVMNFFKTATGNLLDAEGKAGVGHHVALSVVGTERLQESGYFRAKLAQEKLIAASGRPYTIVRATQFFEFMGGIAQAATLGQDVRLPSALMQPMSADDVAAALADYALGPPMNRIVAIAGPDAMGIDEAVGRFLIATGDARKVIVDEKAPYYGIPVSGKSLIPIRAERLAPTHLGDWLVQHAHASTT
jgi:uncharacterized protein YbjT (DUF2867 family)